jgi:ring-1,2-phenylacetyl-CoA epoxidase subunit PaaD
MVTETAARGVWEVAAETPDPELPFLTIADLGILRAVERQEASTVVTITPTYSGCPAMREIGHDVRQRLEHAGYGPVEVRTRLAPAWTSDWITESGRRKLTEAGVAPPGQAPSGPVPLRLAPTRRAVSCPLCGSDRTSVLAEFGATACTALYRCDACREPFEHVKEI